MKSTTALNLLTKAGLPYSIVYGGEFLESCVIDSPRVQRPGLAMAGFYHHLRPGRVQLFGETELKFMETLDKSLRQEVINELVNISRCICVIAKNMPVPGEILAAAEKIKTPVVSMKDSTALISGAFELFLSDELAPETVLHGVCLEIYSMGVVITGKSGIGKSEAALELIKRGHKLVSDDVVHIKRRQNDLIGYSDDILHNYIELRGVGILNISDMFGLTAIHNKKRLDMIIDFVDYREWAAGENMDRIGINDKKQNILGVELPLLACPVSPGRNMTEIVELAVKNQILKIMGRNSTEDFSKSVADKIMEKRNE